MRGRLESQARQISSIEDRLSRGENETQDLEKRFEQQQFELAQHTERLQEVERVAQQCSARLALKSEERDRAQGQLRERERGMEAARQQVLKLLGEASTLKNQLAQIDQYLVGIDRDVERIQRDEASANNDRERLEALKAELSQKQSARQLELQTTVEQRRTVDEELSTRKARAAEARRKLEELRAETSRLKARRDSLEEVLSHRVVYDGIGEAALQSGGKGSGARISHRSAYWPTSSKSIRRIEKAAEEFLHEELEYVVVKDWEQAERGIAYMRSDMDGRATFLVHPEADETIPQASTPSPAAEQGIVAKLSDVLRLTNGFERRSGRFAAPLVAMLHRRGSICGAAAGLAVSGYVLPAVRWCLLSRSCRQRRQEDRQRTARAEARTARSFKPAQRQSRRNSIGRRACWKIWISEMAQLTEDLERLRGQQQRQEKEAVSLDHEVRKMGEEFNRANSRLSVARTELQRLMQERERSAEQP